MAETILVGVDASERSDDALALARQLARLLEAELVLVNAYPYEPGADGVERPEYERYVRSQAEETLVRRQEEADVPGTRTASVAAMSPARALYTVAEREHPAAIVLGATRRAVRDHVALGSVSERLLSGSPCPVAIAPRGYADAARSLRRLGAAYVPTDSGMRAVGEAASLALAADAELRLIAVVDPSVVRVDANAGRARDDELVAAQRAVAEQHLAAVAEGLPPGVQSVREILSGEPAQQLLERSAGLDLLVCGSRDYGPVSGVHVGGVSRALMHEARCPVMIVPR